MTKTVQSGDTVTLHYKGTLEDGTPFDSSYDREAPMTVVVGAGQVIQGFDEALPGLQEGDKSKFTVNPDMGYGDRDPEANVSLEKAVFPEDFEFSDGMTVPLAGPGGQTFLATITEIAGSTVTADLNHPMAGKDLTFEVEILKIEGDEASDS